MRFKTVCLLALLRQQMLRFEEFARYPFRFAAFMAMSLYVMAVSALLAAMAPHKDVIVDNILSPAAFYIALFVLIHFCSAAYIGFRMRDLSRTL